MRVVRNLKGVGMRKQQIDQQKRIAIEKRIFEKCRRAYEERGLIIDEDWLRNVISLANTDGDGMKRVVFQGATYLVPIEDIILDGLRGCDVPKYQREK